MWLSHSLRIPAALITGVLCAAGGPLQAQEAGPNATPLTLRAEYLANMAEVEQKVLSLAEAIPAEKYSWRPGAGVRSVAEVLMHIAAEHFVYIPGAVGAKPPATLGTGTNRDIIGRLDKVTDKAEVIGKVREAFAYQKSVLEGADAKLATGRITSFGRERTVSSFFTAFVADQHEHLGQLIAYARMNGVVPPWSQKP